MSCMLASHPRDLNSKNQTWKPTSELHAHTDIKAIHSRYAQKTFCFVTMSYTKSAKLCYYTVIGNLLAEYYRDETVKRGPANTFKVGTNVIRLGVEQSKAQGSIEHCTISFNVTPRIASAIVFEYTEKTAQAFGIICPYKLENGRMTLEFYVFQDKEFNTVRCQMQQVVEVLVDLSRD